MRLILPLEGIDDKEYRPMTPTDRIAAALAYAERYGQIDGGQHKAWVIDQMVRSLLGTEDAYIQWVLDYEGEDYEWDTGIAP